MELNQETIKKINRFAGEQAPQYLSEAEMTYYERLQKAGNITKDKIISRMEKLKKNSERAQEAKDDMIVYMSDYVNDLVSRGYSEEEAFVKARDELQFRSDTQQSMRLQDKYKRYYDEMPLTISEAIGMYYGASAIIGLVLGGVAGLVFGILVLEEHLVLSAAVGSGAGILLGAAAGMLMHGKLLRNYNAGK